MATAEEVQALRYLIAEPTEERYPSQALSDRLDVAQGSQNRVAAEIWQEKAALAAELVDVSEGGSSRKLGDIHEQALGMARHFSALDAASSVSGGTRVHRLRR